MAHKFDVVSYFLFIQIVHVCLQFVSFILIAVCNGYFMLADVVDVATFFVDSQFCISFAREPVVLWHFDHLLFFLKMSTFLLL